MKETIAEWQKAQGSCDEEQKNQIKSRTALTRKGSSSRMLANGSMKRF